MDVLLKIIATTLAINQLNEDHNRLIRPQTLLNSYDYIVVGGGTAGCIVAARLAEDSTKTVLLLEAGGAQNHIIDTPALQEMVEKNDFYEWNYPLIRQSNAYKAYTDGSVPFLLGKGFGGSTIHNSMNYWREDEEYFNLFDTLYGVKNWTFADVLPFFLKSENNFDKNIVKKYPKFHRTGGPLGVSTAQPPDIMLRRYVNIAMRYGADYTFTDGRNPMGFGGNSGLTIMQRTIANGTRQSTSTAFLEKDIKPNLTTIGFAFVTKILFNSKKRAIGVKFKNKNTGEWVTVSAKREVILSAGAIGSVKLLLLSGIGPEDHLNSMQIPVVSDVKGVGSRMSYFYYFTEYFDVRNQTEIPKPFQTVDNKYDFYVQRKGPLAYKAAGMQCMKDMNFNGNPDIPRGCFTPRTLFLMYDLEEYVNGKVKQEEWKDYFRPYLKHAVFPIILLLTRIQTNETIRLISDNPFDNPIISPCAFCNEEDLEDAIKLFQSALQFYENQDIQQYIRRFDKPIPGCTPCADDWYCHQYVKCILQTFTGGLYLCGTARMGDTSIDSDAVVDSRLRVKGVSGLRVIDYSVIPLSSPQQQTNVIMAAEKGVQMIKDDNIH